MTQEIPNIEVSHFFENDNVGIAITVTKKDKITKKYKTEIIKIIVVNNLSNKPSPDSEGFSSEEINQIITPLPANGFDSISFKASVNGEDFLPFSSKKINKIIGAKIVSSLPSLSHQPNQKTLLIKLPNKNHLLCFDDDGDTYTGEVVGSVSDFVAKGKGILRFANGERYEGQFENDEFNGDGTYYFPNGDYFEGNWRDGFLITNRKNQKDKNLISIRPNNMDDDTQPIIPVYDVATINEDTTDAEIEEIIQNSIQQNNGKLRIAIDTHGDEEGFLDDEDFIKRTLGFIADYISRHNRDAAFTPVKKIDLRLYSCYGAAFVRENQEWLSAMVEKTGIPLKITSGPDNRGTSNIVHDGKRPASLAIEGDLNSVVLEKVLLYPTNYILSEEERKKNTAKGYTLLDANKYSDKVWKKVETTEKLQDFVDHKPSEKPELPASPGANPSIPEDSTFMTSWEKRP